MKRRAFTLIEVLICLGILAIVTIPLLTMVEGVNSAYGRSIRLVNLRSDLDRVGFRMQRLLRAENFTLNADNRGLSSATGKSIRWEDDKILLSTPKGNTVLTDSVTFFSVFRREGVTTVYLELLDPATKRSERKKFLIEEGGYATRI